MTEQEVKNSRRDFLRLALGGSGVAALSILGLKSIETSATSLNNNEGRPDLELDDNVTLNIVTKNLPSLELLKKHLDLCLNDGKNWTNHKRDEFLEFVVNNSIKSVIVQNANGKSQGFFNHALNVGTAVEDLHKDISELLGIANESSLSYGIVLTENSGGTDKVSFKGASGIVQVMPKTSRGMGFAVTSNSDPRRNAVLCLILGAGIQSNNKRIEIDRKTKKHKISGSGSKILTFSKYVGPGFIRRNTRNSANSPLEELKNVNNDKRERFAGHRKYPTFLVGKPTLKWLSSAVGEMFIKLLPEEKKVNIIQANKKHLRASLVQYTQTVSRISDDLSNALNYLESDNFNFEKFSNQSGLKIDRDTFLNKVSAIIEKNRERIDKERASAKELLSNDLRDIEKIEFGGPLSNWLTTNLGLLYLSKNSGETLKILADEIGTGAREDLGAEMIEKTYQKITGLSLKEAIPESEPEANPVAPLEHNMLEADREEQLPDLVDDLGNEYYITDKRR